MGLWDQFSKLHLLRGPPLLIFVSVLHYNLVIKSCPFLIMDLNSDQGVQPGFRKTSNSQPLRKGRAELQGIVLAMVVD